jgi:hypothetical protein
MGKFISTIFDFLAVAFDKIPLLNKLKGYRSVLGLIGLAVVEILSAKGVIGGELKDGLVVGLSSYAALSLNAKGRE